MKMIFVLLLATMRIANANSVSNIRLNVSDNTQRIVIDNTQRVVFDTFLLQNPNRLVVDLRETDNDEIKAPALQSNSVIYTVRVGKLSKTDARLVFDLNIKPKSLKSFYLQPTADNKNHRVVIDLSFDDMRQADLIGELIDDIEKTESISSLIDKINKKEPSANQLTKQPIYNISQTPKKPRIIIDAGHGGKDPGAEGLRGTKEKVLALIYAKSIKRALEDTGKYKVYLTRDQDFFIDLHERVSIARRLKCDLFISVHADSATNSNARGLSIYTLSQTASDRRTAQLAQKENRADIIGGINLYGEYQDTINTLVDISRAKAMNDSKKFAKMLENQLIKRGVKGHGENIRKFGNFAVLTSADMPSILLEIGFLSNSKDEKMIRSASYKGTITNSIVGAAGSYFK